MRSAVISWNLARRQRLVEVQRAVGRGGDERQVDLGLLDLAELDLGLLGGLLEALGGHPSAIPDRASSPAIPASPAGPAIRAAIPDVPPFPPVPPVVPPVPTVPPVPIFPPGRHYQEQWVAK